MGSQKELVSEFVGCFLLVTIAALLPTLKLEGLDFALALSVGYGLLLVVLSNMEASSLNPALTMADIFYGTTKGAAGGLIIASQFAGAASASLLLSIFMHRSDLFPASAGSPQAGQAMLLQLTFGAALVFAYLQGERRNKYDGMWLATLMYGAFVVGGDPVMCLNPAAALAVDVARGVSGASVDETMLAVLILMPLVGAGVGFLLHRSADQNLQVSELVGTFFLSFGILAAALKGGFPSGVGLSLYAAAIIRMVAPVSGGSLNPAVVGGSLLSEGRGISNDIAGIWLFQIIGATLAALLVGQAKGSLPSTVAPLNGDGRILLIAFGISALLMFAYCINFGDFFGSPAAAFVGAVYGASLVAGKTGVPINPATALGSIFGSMIKSGAGVDPLESTAAVLVPVFGCMAGAVLLRFIPSDYRRRL